MKAYYNEFDPYAAEWLRRLIAAGHIADGYVDERDVRDVKPSDLEPFAQCHFFAGIGIWSHALRAAGWRDDQPIWTASCPCQPFSAAGAKAGIDDERHLWPAIDWLAEQCRPQAIFGEQVSSPDGLAWLDTVSTDLEAKDYAIGTLDTCAASVGAPHIRQRLYFAAHDTRPATIGPVDAQRVGRDKWTGQPNSPAQRRRSEITDASPADRMDNTEHPRLEGHERAAAQAGWYQPHGSSVPPMLYGSMANTDSDGRPERWQNNRTQRCDGISGNRAKHRPSATNGFWRDADWLYCTDEMWRPVESGTFPLAHGAPSRVGRLRAYGNGLCAGQATEFIRAYMTRGLVDLKTTPAGDLFEWGL